MIRDHLAMRISETITEIEAMLTVIDRHMQQNRTLLVLLMAQPPSPMRYKFGTLLCEEQRANLTRLQQLINLRKEALERRKELAYIDSRFGVWR